MTDEDRAEPNGRPGRRKIEREFGVPVAGEILPPELWTKTAFRKTDDAELDNETLFGRAAPLVVDLGCGNGRFLIGSAVWRPDCDHLGVDILPLVLRYAARRGNQRGLSNLRFAQANARVVVERWLPTHGAAEIHCYHPQPYYDPSEFDQRLATPMFFAQTLRCLKPNGLLFLQTDHGEYWKYMRACMVVFFDVEERREPWPDAPKGRTRREILSMKRGLPIFRAVARPKPNLSFAAACQLAQSLAMPTFAADPNLRELDDLEAE